ncbi:TIMELESS-interacting protein isoform X2 [Palaemon carinicauda]|uniref:TIMELESS-interacting protein isoform X2 n=1 Tax=Palaemon carinicauda TaxID=392227 RepID=UPI0035B5C525
MDVDMEEMFGRRDSASRRGSVASGSDGGSISDREEEEDDGGRDNPMDEALEVPDPEAEGRQQEATAKIVKPKRVIQNPVPKFDLARVAGPRGIPAVQKYFKTVKFQGKGHEKEDLDLLLKHLEHWAHRMYPRFPFKNVLEHMEKLGSQRPVKVMMKRYRLDMFEEHEVNRDINDDEVVVDEEDVNPEPVVDVFDELLGPAFPSSSQPAAVPPTPKSVTLTSEQRERVERNKRLAEERRLARMREQQNSTADISMESVDNITSSIPSVGASADQVEDSSALIETEENSQAPCTPKDPKLYGSPMIAEGARADKVEDSSALMETEDIVDKHSGEYDQTCTSQVSKLHETPVIEEGTGSVKSSFCRSSERPKEQKTDIDNLPTSNTNGALDNKSVNNIRISSQEKSEDNSEETGLVIDSGNEEEKEKEKSEDKLEETGLVIDSGNEEEKEKEKSEDKLEETGLVIDSEKEEEKEKEKSEDKLEETGLVIDSEKEEEQEENLCTEEDMLTMLEDDI